MGEDVLALAERAWTGDLDLAENHPFFVFGDPAEVAPGTLFVPSFANVTAFSTSDGLVLVDVTSSFMGQHVFDRVRAWSDEAAKVAIFTHGHIDHVGGLGPFEVEGPVRVIAHEGVAARFDRYRLTAGYNTVINRRQFQTDVEWPTEYRYPDETFSGDHGFELGGVRFELRHARGETDDHCWVWVPDRGVLCCGDFFIWASPNAGNPQKAPRYPLDWAEALKAMAKVDAEVMLPGHGFPVVGHDRIREVLQSSADLLDAICEQTLDLMNRGLPLDEIVERVEVPRTLGAKPYLKPIYDEPEFVVRNLWRLYAGWYDGRPSHLKPASEIALAREIASLVGGARRLSERASELMTAGDERVAGHLAEWAHLASENGEERSTFERVFEERAATERSTMSKGIFGSAARGEG